MEKARLMLRSTNRGKIVAKLHFEESGKEMPFPEYQNADTGLNDTIVQVKRDKGRIVKVINGELALYESQAVAPAPNTPSRARKGINTGKSNARKMASGPPAPGERWERSMEREHLQQIGYPAHAPYNFIPLNRKVVEIARNNIPSFDQYHDTRLTGWIDLQIETKTPLYIRDTLDRDQLESKLESKDNPDFFSPASRIRIPGSSLRGMTRSLVEIVAFGKFEHYHDRRLYFRGLADTSNLGKEYRKNMTSSDSRRKPPGDKVSAGVLYKSGLGYKIISSGADYKQIRKADAKKRVANQKKRYNIFEFYKLIEGYLIVSGDMPKKDRDWLVKFPTKDAHEFLLTENDVENYKNDITRSDKAPNLIELASAGEPVPCFHVAWQDSRGNQRISFGHTVMFRLGYRKTVGDHVPLGAFRIDSGALARLKTGRTTEKTLKALAPLTGRDFSKKELVTQLKNLKISDSDIQKIMVHAAITDIPEAIFGNEKSFAGRVFFEDAFPEKGETDLLMGTGTPKILSSPKPTTFQHYLVQSSDSNQELNHYNSPAAIRGNKMYWHKSGNNWKEMDREALEKPSKQYTNITPVRPGIRFAGRIRFENLSETELGALLFTLDLPEGCFHKLGMGKPLGLGSVHIIPRLFLSDRKKRYGELFSNSDTDESKKIPAIKQAFEAHIAKETGADTPPDLWATDRIKELKTMLDFQTGVNLESKNRYMTITPQNEFKDRPILPHPTAAALSIADSRKRTG